MKIKKKLTRKQLLRQEDEFISTSTKVFNWIKDNFNQVIMGLLVFLVIAAIVLSVRYRSKTNLMKSNKLLYIAKNIYYAPVRPPTQDQKGALPQQGFTTSQEKYQKAIQLFEELIQLYPGSQAAEEGRFFIPNCLYFLGKYDPALEAFDSYLVKYPKGLFSEQAKVGIGFVHAAKGDYNKSIEVFQDILENNPDFILRDVVYMQLGHSYGKAGSPEKAKEAYQNVIINYPNSPFLEDAEDKMNMLAEEG